MIFSYNINKEDIAAFQLQYMNNSAHLRRVSLISHLLFPALSILLAVYFYSAGGSSVCVVNIIFACIWLLFWPSYSSYRRLRIISKLLNEGNIQGFIGPHTTTFEEDIIKCRYPGGYTETKREAIIKFSETPEYMFLYNSQMSGFTLPKREMSPEIQDYIKKKYGNIK